MFLVTIRQEGAHVEDFNPSVSSTSCSTNPSSSLTRMKIANVDEDAGNVLSLDEFGKLKLVERKKQTFDELNSAVQAILSKVTVRRISIGPHMCVCADFDGTLYTIAPGIDGQYDISQAEIGVVEKISVGDWHSIVLGDNGFVYSLGRGTSGELGIGSRKVWESSPKRVDLGSPCIDVSAGSHFSVVVTVEGKVFTFGSGSYGRLGNGFFCDCLLPTLLYEMEGICVSRCFAATWHTLVLVDETKDVYVWGWNKWGAAGTLTSDKGEIIETPRRLNELDILDDCHIDEVITGTSCTAFVLNQGKEIYLLGQIGIDPYLYPFENIRLNRFKNVISLPLQDCGKYYGLRSIDVESMALICDTYDAQKTNVIKIMNASFSTLDGSLRLIVSLESTSECKSNQSQNLK